jgi:hypothetical protein
LIGRRSTSGACAAKTVVFDKMEVEDRLVFNRRFSRRMLADHGPCASPNVVIDVIPEFVVTAPRLQALSSRQQGFAEAEGAVSWTDQGTAVGDSATFERDLGLKVFVAVSCPMMVVKHPDKTVIIVVDLGLQSLLLAGKLSSKASLNMLITVGFG